MPPTTTTHPSIAQDIPAIELRPVSIPSLQACATHANPDPIHAAPASPSPSHLNDSDPPLNAISAEEPTTPLTRSVKLKLISACFSFFVAGVNDGSLGPLIPYILRAYGISTGFVTVVYGTTFLGWLLAAVANSYLAIHLPFGSILLLGATLQLLAQALRFWTPPFGLYASTFFVVALGQALQDSHLNTFVTTVKGAHRWLGFVHAMYMLGNLVAPFVATPIAAGGDETRNSRWGLFYLFPLGMGVLNVVLVLVAFRDSVPWKRAGQTTSQGTGATDERSGKNKIAIKEMKDTLRLPAVWLLSLFYFFYLGASFTAGGWVVEYLVQVRNGSLASVGYIPAGVAGGSFLGRLLLAEPTFRLGERRMLLLYCVLALTLQLVFWLVPSIIASAVALSFMGFFLGPLFATGISVGSKLFPQKIQPAALGFVFVLAQAGAAIFPAVTGLIASRAGVGVLQPILVGLLVIMGISWMLVPKVPARSE
ncbi:hypothetical protein MMC24_006102 [Lignoscripta atroalba]|nr:hypothetical protein [Lignoscripta atroalba]